MKLVDTTQIELFHRQGLLRLSDLHPKGRMRSVKEKIVRELSRLHLLNSGQKNPGALQGLTPFQQIAKLASIVKVDVHEALCTSDVLAAVNTLSERTAVAEQGSQLLLSPGRQGHWSLDGLNWHVDIAAKPSNRSPGIQAFYLVDDVAPKGGATLALARSHNMQPEALRRFRTALTRSTDVRQALKDVDVEVVEMAGRAGDVYLMDMRVLHTPSVNSTPDIRMMATTRFGFRT